ncbi:hypothetical protein PAERUG_P45_London_17_VIM_2_12_12_03596 [Pseudomonas aeruginosa]|nr:hypothetical protein PAERUG_P45_London_17_VIM_2_12_12_03596 [Pseudomonas aeruginosa]CRS12296.1 hypothetical protein PAERUG_P48_London_17_VIM_2_01_13_04517 [Pseudomonas aeruginosa]
MDRSQLQMSSSYSPPLRPSMAAFDSSTIFSASRPWSNGGFFSTSQNCGLSAGISSLPSNGARSRFCCLAVSPGRISSRSVRPISSPRLRTPRRASHSRVSVAMKVKKLITIAVVPMKWSLRNLSFCVATPVAQLFRWQMRRYLQPRAIIGAVPKPKLSAPRMAALITSRPVFRPPSVCTRTLPRRSLPRRVWWVSARPSSQGEPAYLIEVIGEAPVPPS